MACASVVSERTLARDAFQACPRDRFKLPSIGIIEHLDDYVSRGFLPEFAEI